MAEKAAFLSADFQSPVHDRDRTCDPLIAITEQTASTGRVCAFPLPYGLARLGALLVQEDYIEW
jgi:hypothetical protein